MAIIEAKYTKIVNGSRMKTSKVAIIDNSTSLMSLVILEIKSPLRSSVKKPIGKESTF